MIILATISIALLFSKLLEFELGFQGKSKFRVRLPLFYSHYLRIEGKTYQSTTAECCRAA